jgi:hypothetical protein
MTKVIAPGSRKIVGLFAPRRQPVNLRQMSDPSQARAYSGKKFLAVFSVGCLAFALAMAFGTYLYARTMTPILKERFEREQQQKQQVPVEPEATQAP